MIDEFQQLMRQLDDETLRQIALWKMEGWTHQEIAQKLGCGVRTVEYRVALIRKVMRAEVENE